MPIKFLRDFATSLFVASSSCSFYFQSSSVLRKQPFVTIKTPNKMSVVEHCNEFFSIDRAHFKNMYGMVILNSELPPIKSSIHNKLLKNIWRDMSVVGCADGGANRVYDEMEEGEHEQFIPDFIAGDLDSIRNDVRSYYTSRHCSIIEKKDQDENDLDKSLKILLERMHAQESRGSSSKPLVAIIFGAFGGRFDHEMAAIHSLFAWSKSFDRVVLLDGKATSTLLLGPGNHRLRLITSTEGPTCGLIPIAGPVDHVDSTGLMWNIGGRSLEWGKLVSSSNSVDPTADGLVEVKTSHSLLWTCSLAS